jgi:hypothetical protein
MTWILGVVVALVALVAAMALVGSRLPIDHLATSRARYDADIDAVWSAVEAEVAGSDTKVEIVEREVPRRLMTRIPPGGPFGGTWTFELASANGTTLTITERGEVYNVIFRFLSRFVFGHYGMQEKFLRSVGARLHETAIPERLSDQTDSLTPAP